MNQMTPLQSPARQPAAVNPFARALAAKSEFEQPTYGAAGHDRLQNPSSPLLSNTLANTGGSFGETAGQQFSPDFLKEQQAKALEDQRLKMLLKRRHDEINPVEMHQVFAQREIEVKKQIAAVQAELQGLVKDVEVLHAEVAQTVKTNVVEAGERGAYYLAFLARVRKTIMWLRQLIKNPPSLSSSWSNTSKGKQSKKRKGPGADFGKGHQVTSTIQDMMHHERSTSTMGA